MFPKDATSQKNLARANTYDPLPGSGTVIDRTKNMLRAVYDFSVLGGAVGNILLVDDQGNPATLPQGAIVTNVSLHIVTAVTSGGAATLSLGSNIAAAVADLLGATAKATLVPTFLAGIPVGTVATWIGPVTAVNGSQLQVAVGTAALTAGKIYFMVEYTQSSLT